MREDYFYLGVIGFILVAEAVSLYLEYRSAKRIVDDLIDDIIVAMHVSDDLKALEEKEKENNSQLVTRN